MKRLVPQTQRGDFMGFNLIDAVRSQFSNDLVRRISHESGEDPQATEKILPGAIAAVGAGVVDKASNEAGAQRLLSQLQEGGFTRAESPEWPDTARLDESMREGAVRGQGLLSGMLGDKASGVADALTRFGGLRNSGSSMRLLSLVAPMMMGILGRQVRGQHMGASGLMQMLGGQRSFISAALPAGLGGLLGLGKSISEPRGLHEQVAAVSSRSVPVRETVTRRPERKGIRSWAIPLALVALVALVWGVVRGRRTEERLPQAVRSEQVTPRTDEGVAATRPTSPPVTPPSSAGPPLQEQVGPAPTEPSQPQEEGVGGAGLAGARTHVQDASGLRRAFEGPSGEQGFVLDGVEFRTGSSQLTAQGRQVVNRLGAVMKEKSDSRIRVTGYTDSTGDAAANRQLSQERADAVRTALVQDGIAANRVETDGRGSDSPLAPNDTDASRAENRRVEVQVLRGP